MVLPMKPFLLALASLLSVSAQAQEAKPNPRDEATADPTPATQPPTRQMTLPELEQVMCKTVVENRDSPKEVLKNLDICEKWAARLPAKKRVQFKTMLVQLRCSLTIGQDAPPHKVKTACKGVSRKQVLVYYADHCEEGNRAACMHLWLRSGDPELSGWAHSRL